MKSNELIGNGVYTTKVEAEGYLTGRVERNVGCNVEECDKCNPNTHIVLAKKSEVDTKDAILTVTSQTGAKLKFVVYKGEDAGLKKNENENTISIPSKAGADVTIAVTQDIRENGKLNNTDAIFTLRYGESLVKLKIPSDAYHDEKYWLIGLLKINANKGMEFFSDNFYANTLDVFGSIKRSIGLTLPQSLPAITTTTTTTTITTRTTRTTTTI